MERIFAKAKRLENTNYDLRGKLLDRANELKQSGIQFSPLNIGNTEPFGLLPPEEMITFLINNIRKTFGYTDSKGMPEARLAVLQYYQERGIRNLSIENIFHGNGVSDLIGKVFEASLNPGDEILVGIPDYPLWTAKIIAFGGKAVHFVCDEESDWLPDIKDIKSKITDKTVGIVIIPFNNPTGAVYPQEILEEIIQIARDNQLMIFSDEIYDKIIYEGHKSISIASLADDVLFITLNGLSKVYRLPGWRSGWAVFSGKTRVAQGFLQGMKELCDQSLGPNAPGQIVVPSALGGHQSIFDLTKSGGRLYKQRETGYRILTSIPGITCVKPKAALYFFPKIDIKKFNITSDEKFLLDLLEAKKILFSTGKGFNWPQADHFRIVFLPHEEDLVASLQELGDFLSTYKQE
ncbi:MAG: aminotransferase class I/II-fold pyridoxal phosphate-dependent enzyme [Candidatus Parcubacteria bacterium]|nr:aminotransferase class I/II-fold pyridoxal phosphate-dependent enzyme [Candidatus Parcubacteria bacterium]